MTKTEQILNECKNIYAMNYGFASYEDFQHKLSIGNSNAHDFQDAIELLASHLFAQRMSEKFAEWIGINSYSFLRLDAVDGPKAESWYVDESCYEWDGDIKRLVSIQDLYTEFLTELNKEK